MPTAEYRIGYTRGYGTALSDMRKLMFQQSLNRTDALRIAGVFRDTILRDWVFRGDDTMDTPEMEPDND